MKFVQNIGVLSYILFIPLLSNGQMDYTQYQLENAEKFSVTLTLLKDHTFSIFSIAHFSNMNFSSHGRWKKKGKLLFLKQDLGKKSGHTEIDSISGIRSKMILIKISDSFYKPIPNTEVRITIPDQKTYKYFYSNKKGIIRIRKESIFKSASEIVIFNAFDQGWYVRSEIDELQIRRFESVRLFSKPVVYRIKGDLLIQRINTKSGSKTRSLYPIPQNAIFRKKH